MRRAARQDSNSKLIVEALRVFGWRYFDTSRVGNGFTDGIAVKGEAVRFVEIKTPKGKLRDKQVSFLVQLDPRLRAVLRSVDDAAKLR